MTTFDIAHYRLFHQCIVASRFDQPGQVVAHLGALQAQDYPAALWAIGLRLKDAATKSLVEEAIAARHLVRTWPMRGTLHFVAAADVRWMLKLLTPRIISATAARQRQLEVDPAVLARSRQLFIEALQGDKQLSRAEMYQVLAQGNIVPTGQRGIHIIGRLAQEGLLCQGSYRDTQPSFALLDEWLPPGRALERDEALAELALRYFNGHGPATLPDFERWAGLKISDARAGLEMVKARLRREELNGQTYWLAPGDPAFPPEVAAVHLLPGFDEYVLGYKDRSAVLEAHYFQKVVPGGNGIFMPTLVSNGRVVGLWKRSIKKGLRSFTPEPFTSLSPAEVKDFETAAARYARFLAG